MAQVDFRERRLAIKLVYYGPPLSGKTTNLQFIHSRVDALNRGRLMTLDTKDDRTLFFDLLPLFFKDSNLSLQVRVYTVPGQPLHDATRRIVLRGADGVAFVADSRRSEIAANNASYEQLLANLEALSINRSAIGRVIQFNKRDLPDIMSDQAIREMATTTGCAVYPASAIDGRGVFQTFFGLLQATWRALDVDKRLAAGFGVDGDAFLAAMRAHMGVTLQESGRLPMPPRG